MTTTAIWNPYYEAWKAVGLRQEVRGWGWDFYGTTPIRDAVRKSGEAFRKREELVMRYSWAVPSPEAIRWIAKRCDRIAEMGAGRGYWAKLLADAGVDVIAYEPTVELGDLCGNTWHACSEAVGLYFDLRQGDSTKAAAHKDRTLMLCWPPYDDPMAQTALEHYQGSQVLFIGEGDGGCCGGDGFWKIIADEWLEVGYTDIPQWIGMRDWVTIYRHKDRPATKRLCKIMLEESDAA